MFTEDLAPFFDVDTGYGLMATVGGVSGVRVLFDNGFTLGNVGLIGMAGTQPSITLATSSVPSSPVGATVVVNSTTYVVAAHEPDGTGVSRLLLELAA